MCAYQLRPISLSAYATGDMLIATAGFAADASADIRQRTIDYLVRMHGINLTTTKTLRYDATFMERDGRNKNGTIQIGPGAFRQDRSWLANVIFHEVIHSDQFAFYGKYGMDFTKYTKADEPVRVMVALDEFEGFYWPWRNSRALGLEPQQMAELEREVRLWQVEIDDAPTLELVRTSRFNEARLALMKRLGLRIP